MAIPYTNRSAIAIIPELVLRNKPAATMDEIQLEFIRVYPAIRIDSVFDCMQFLGKGRLRLTFTNASMMENFIHDGLTFRGHPLELRPISTRRWVNVRHYPYGAPRAPLEKKLEQYGKWLNCKRDSLRNVDLGTISVLMEVEKNIPSKIYVNGHRCHVQYSGQQQTCFKCNKTGHHSKQCPDHQAIAPQQAGPQLAATQQVGKPTAAQIVAGAKKPPSPRTIVGQDQPTNHPKTPVQPAKLSIDAVIKIALPTSPPAGQTTAQDGVISKTVGHPQPPPPPPIPPNPNNKMTDVIHDGISPPSRESKRRLLSFTPPPNLPPLSPIPSTDRITSPLPTTPMATTPPPIGFSPSQGDEALSQGGMDESKFSPIVSSGSPAVSQAPFPPKIQPKPLAALQDTAVSPDLFSDHSPSSDRDPHQVSAKHNLLTHLAPKRPTIRGQRRSKSKPVPNYKAARPKRQPDPSFETENRFTVLAKLPNDGQSSFVLRMSSSEPDVGLTSSGSLIFKDNPPPVRRIPNHPYPDTDTPASDV